MDELLQSFSKYCSCLERYYQNGHVVVQCFILFILCFVGEGSGGEAGPDEDWAGWEAAGWGKVQVRLSNSHPKHTHMAWHMEIS